MRDRGVLSRALNLAGAVVVLWFLVQQLIDAGQTWLWVAGIVACVAWLVRQLLPDGGVVALILTLVALAAGSVIAADTNVLGYVPAVISLSTLLADPRRPAWIGWTSAAASAVVVTITALVTHADPTALIGAIAALAIAALVGVSRRQNRQASAAQRDLLEERVRTAAAEERARIARDLHDVLAHSLGGLVVQLDAVEAQLEAGHASGALERTRSARALAAEGLDEARGAVDALRDPGEALDLSAAVTALAETHRLLGGEVGLHETGIPVPLPPATASAFRRAAQELLTNARKHAPGAAIDLALDWRPDAVVLTVRTPRSEAGALARTGGGRGLAGIRERFAELPGGTVEVDDDDPFTVRVEAAR